MAKANNDLLMYQVVGADAAADFVERYLTGVVEKSVVVVNSSLQPCVRLLTIDDITSLQSTLNGKIDSALRGVVNGVATLGADGKIPAAQLPAIAITDVSVVTSQTAQLALTVQTGDVAVRSDLNKTYINKTGNNTAMTDWVELLNVGNVLSVAGRTGAVVLSTSDISGLGNSATLNTGTTAGTVAIGNHGHTEMTNHIAAGELHTSTTEKNAWTSKLSWTSAPATAVSAGTAGMIAYDDDYFYVCVAANTWKRTTLSKTWVN